MIDGWMVKDTARPNNWKSYSYRYFETKKEAKQYALDEAKRRKRMKMPFYYRVIPVKLRRCSHCNSLIEEDCFRCEDAMYEARLEMENERRELGDDDEH